MNLTIYPKLNIFLKIIGYANGFHQIQSRFVLARGALYDEMEISHAQSFILNGDFGCKKEDNLIYKAKCAMQTYLEQIGRDSKVLDYIHIEVQKSIPKGAGLGGGSADAGVFLRAVNTFLELDLADSVLLHIAQQVGADVSFFVSGFTSANAYGNGDCIESFDENLPTFEIYTPPLFCDTKKIYQTYADSIIAHKRTYSAPVEQWLQLSSTELLALGHTKSVMNDLFTSAVTLYPALQDIAQTLGDEWYFSGSGSSFFKIAKA